MAFNILSFLALLVGLYLVYQADKQKNSGSKIIYAFAGIVATLWSLFTVVGAGPVRFNAMPLAFGLFAVATLYSRGASRAVFGAISILLFLNILL